MTTVKQGGVQKQLTGIYVKQAGVAKQVQEGWVKQGGVVKQFFTTAPPAPAITPTSWSEAYFGAPFSEDRSFTADSDGPFSWSWEQTNSTGGAAMAIVSGQGTATATYRATCSGAGELFGTVVCAGVGTASVGLVFDGGL